MSFALLRLLHVRRGGVQVNCKHRVIEFQGVVPTLEIDSLDSLKVADR